MAIGICPGDLAPFRLAREEIQKDPERKKDESEADFAARVAAVSAHNERVRALEASGKVTTWQLRCLSSRDQGKCIQAVDRLGIHEACFDIVRLGLAGWDRLEAKGKPILWQGGRAVVFGVTRDDIIRDAVLDSITLKTCIELALGIVALGVTEEELGNS